MRALFLGTADGHTSAERDHSGLLLQASEQSLLLDCGAMAGRLLLRAGHDPDIPGALWLSHMHSDHIGQFGSLIQSLWLRQRHAPLSIFGPTDVLRVMKDWLERCILFPGLVGFPLEWHGVTPGKPVTWGPFTLTAFATEHLASLAAQFRQDYPKTCFDCYGVTLDHAGQRYVYSADIAAPEDLGSALQSGRVRSLVCEVTHFPERNLFRYLASYPVDNLWLTHYPDRLAGQEKALREMAKEEKFNGVVHLVQDNVAREI